MWASVPTEYCKNLRLLIGRTEASAPTLTLEILCKIRVYLKTPNAPGQRAF